MRIPMPSRQALAAAGLGAALLLVVTGLGLLVQHGVAAVRGVPAPAAADAGRAWLRAVVIKGLLPQLALTTLLHPWLRAWRRRHAGPAHVAEAEHPGAFALAVETYVVASLAYCAVAPSLLTVGWAGWPALHMAGPVEQLGTYVGMTATVTLALRGAATWLGRRRPGRTGPGAGRGDV